tara:strand:+ start:7461 stop:7883 length:423 start_codon:yes stop_codon:yes gene_type:complete
MLQANRLSINAIGKVRKPWIDEGINQYKKRMPDFKIYEHKSFNIKNLKNSHTNTFFITLAEEGSHFNSEQFSSLLLGLQNKKITFLIGDTEGISNDIKSSSDLLLSLSSFTFPHELARLILVEQIYRAISITQSSPYHRG